MEKITMMRMRNCILLGKGRHVTLILELKAYHP